MDVTPLDADSERPPTMRPGRKRDPGRDVQILEATLEVLAESGYEGATVDAVAARAQTARATVYRRWPTKLDLVLAAVGHMSAVDAAPEDLPDTGSLRGDLIATVRVDGVAEQRRRIDIMAGLHTTARTEPRLAALFTRAGPQPWVEASRTLLQRAVERGEYPLAEIDTLATVIPTMCVYRAAVEQQPITRDFCLALIDSVVIPAMRGGSLTAEPKGFNLTQDLATDHVRHDPEARP
jgi:AcrR family transcriptional regulator